ncbi:MAG: DUF3881 family protein [Lachnospiraceae bacterium]|nr:DUF3881 family protein [Lachnospiraceae bacterium]
MHSYLKSIGFSNVKTKEEEQRLIDEIIRYANKKSMISISQTEDDQYAEYSWEVAPGMGLTVRGQLDEEDNFRMDHYFPYLSPRFVTSSEETFIEKKSENDSYGALCEDYRLGVALIFHLQNAVDYLRVNRRDRTSFNCPVRVSALASDGTILFPTMKTAEEVRQVNEETKKYAKMLAAAKDGDQEAIDHLAIKEIDDYSTVNDRMKNEDIFSIVDTSFIPYGMESEVYRIVGIILSLEERTNTQTGEKVYLMEIYCNHIVFDLCVNAQDLIGIPEKGRRFRGVVWLQGRVDFGR